MKTMEALEKENEELKRDIAIKSDLISISAHQLRTSLSAMKWILKMFLDGDFGTINSEQKNFIEKAAESDERMIRLVNEMLSINHAEDMLEQIHPQEVDVVKLLDETIFDFSSESYKRGIALIFLRPDKPVAPVVADPDNVRVIVQNLIENGIKYTHKDGKVILSMRDTPESIELSVRDTGIGIEKEDQEHIFTKNFRSLAAKKQDPVGSGLGLYTTKRMVEKHNGKIWFESTPGDGTTFHVTFPRSK